MAKPLKYTYNTILENSPAARFIREWKNGDAGSVAPSRRKMQAPELPGKNIAPRKVYKQ
jgi:hypothetical protein